MTKTGRRTPLTAPRLLPCSAVRTCCPTPPSATPPCLLQATNRVTLLRINCSSDAQLLVATRWTQIFVCGKIYLTTYTSLDAKGRYANGVKGKGFIMKDTWSERANGSV